MKKQVFTDVTFADEKTKKPEWVDLDGQSFLKNDIQVFAEVKRRYNGWRASWAELSSPLPIFKTREEAKAACDNQIALDAPSLPDSES